MLVLPGIPVGASFLILTSSQVDFPLSSLNYAMKRNHTSSLLGTLHDALRSQSKSQSLSHGLQKYKHGLGYKMRGLDSPYLACGPVPHYLSKFFLLPFPCSLFSAATLGLSCCSNILGIFCPQDLCPGFSGTISPHLAAWLISYLLWYFPKCHLLSETIAGHTPTSIATHYPLLPNYISLISLQHLLAPTIIMYFTVNCLCLTSKM